MKFQGNNRHKKASHTVDNQGMHITFKIMQPVIGYEVQNEISCIEMYLFQLWWVFSEITANTIRSAYPFT